MAQPLDPLPVQRVVLFAGGVGYVEHSASVRGDATVTLRFTEGQLDDVLKSLVAEDLGGGRVAAATFPSQMPAERSLGAFGIDPRRGGLAALLGQMVGTEVAVRLGEREVRGVVLGIEAMPQPVGQGVGSVPVLSLLTEAGIEPVRLDQATSATPTDPVLRAELAEAFATLARTRDGRGGLPLELRFLGSGERRVRVGYVVEQPVWKTSYRLVLPQQDGPADLLGWAHVENHTDRDWEGVALSLVSGRPVSFTTDLAAPLFLRRPHVRLDAASRIAVPVQYETGTPPPPPPADAARPATQMRSIGQPAADREQGIDVVRSVESVVTTGEAGELFEYRLGDVRIPRGQAAMLPLLTERIRVERVSLFQPRARSPHPMRGARLTNTTGQALQAGPATLFDDGSYAGDAMLPDLPANADRFVSFAVDLDVTVQTRSSGSPSRLLSSTIRRGVLVLELGSTHQTLYTIENSGSRSRVVLVEHEERRGQLISPEPVEQLASGYRFRQAVGAGRTEVLTVREDVRRSEQTAIVDRPEEDLLRLAERSDLSAAVRAALRRVVDLQRRMNAAEEAVGEAVSHLESLRAEQEQLRRNLTTIPEGSSFFNEQLARLETVEREAQTMRPRIEALREAAEAARERYREHVRTLNVS